MRFAACGSNGMCRGRRRSAVSALRLVVSPPPLCEPDVRVPSHPALHERVERAIGHASACWTVSRNAGSSWLVRSARRTGRRSSRSTGRDLGAPVDVALDARACGVQEHDPGFLEAVLPEVAPADLLPRPRRVLLAKPAHHSAPGVVAQVGEGALCRGVAEVGRPAPRAHRPRRDLPRHGRRRAARRGSPC
jgi:hypothetical protein